MNIKKQFRKSYQKKFDELKPKIIEIPMQGWIKTIRNFFGMTTTQLADRLGVNQSRIVRIEQNEENVKISTMKRIAEAIDCDFVYVFIPREKIDNILYNQARKKALKILNNVNTNMGLENQLSNNSENLEELIEKLINENTSQIWDEKE